MNNYEIILLFRQNLSNKELDNSCNDIVNEIEKNKGKSVAKEYWGLKNLAYKIKKSSSAHYFMIFASINKNDIDKVKKYLSFREDILRHMIIKSEYKYQESRLFLSKDATSYNPSKHLPKKDELLDNLVINV